MTEMAAPPHAPERGWSRRLLGSFHVTGIFWYRFHRWGVSVLPNWGVFLFVLLFTTFFFFFLRKIRRALADNLEAVLGPAGWIERQRRIYRSMWTFAWCLSERYERHATTRPFDIDLEAMETWAEVAASGRGFVLVTAHVGNYEVGSMLPVDREQRRVHVVREKEMDPEAQEFIRKMIEDASGPNYTTHFQDDTNPFQGMVLRDALLAGEIVCMQGDRPRSAGRNVDATLFGRPFPLAAGPAVLARSAGVPIVPVFVFRRRRLAYTVVFRPPIEPPQTGDRDRDLAQMTQRIATEVEWAIRREPFQWFCFRNVWR